MEQQDVRGRVVDSIGQPLSGATIRIIDERGKRTALRTLSDDGGRFSLRDVPNGSILEISFLGYITLRLAAVAEMGDVMLRVERNQLDEVEVVSTGYQKIPKERATGSFEFVDNKLFNRKVSTDFVSRLEDVVPSISSIKNTAASRGALLNINVRGQSTLRSERWPLIVVDGIPYPSKYTEYGLGMFNNINPNDVENITVLKDAAASSIWGRSLEMA